MPPISFDFRDSSVLVTGGTQGIGLAVAEAYARAGANVAICARTEGDVSATVAALDELGAGAVYGVMADLSEPDGAGQLFDDVAANLGVLDILVNNAAAQGNFPFPEMDSARWRWMAQVNLEAPFELSRRFVLARQDPGGVIINVVTTQVMRHAKGRVGYGATKVGLVGLTQTMALELAHRGMRVNAVAPAFVDVPRIYREFDDVDDRLAAMPSGRFIQPDEVAQAILFLSSDGAAAINGVVLPVDGGHAVDGTWVRE